MQDKLSAFFLLEPDLAFLNHGSYGACPRPVFEAYQAWQLRLERQPVSFLNASGDLPVWSRHVRTELAAELGTHPDAIVGMTNATVGLNLVAQSLRLQPGDEILTTDHEYPATEKTWAYVCRRTGARVVRATVPLPLTDAAAFTKAIVDGLTSRTKVLFLSHVTSATALWFPIEAAVAEARARGILTVIDGAHAPGHIPLTLDELGADYYAGNCHKWLMAPKGSAFLYVRPDLQHGIDPLIISHGWTEDARLPGTKGVYGNTPFIDQLEMQGTRDPSAWLAVPDALAFRKAHNWGQVAIACQALARETSARIQGLTGLEPFSTAAFSAPQMIAMPVPDCDPVTLHDTLLSRYGVEIPCYRWKNHTIVRLSVQGYNGQADMDRLVAALGECLPQRAG